MTAEKPYTDLDREGLIRVLDHVSPSEAKVALTYVRILESREKYPKRLLDDSYRKSFKSFPSHKVEWYREAIDLIARALTVAPDQKLKKSEIESIAKLDGLFAKEYVSPEVQKLYENPKNWVYETADHHDIHRRYVGPSDLRILVQENSRFRREDLDSLLRGMEIGGDIKLERNNWQIFYSLTDKNNSLLT